MIRDREAFDYLERNAFRTLPRRADFVPRVHSTPHKTQLHISSVPSVSERVDSIGCVSGPRHVQKSSKEAHSSRPLYAAAVLLASTVLAALLVCYSFSRSSPGGFPRDHYKNCRVQNDAIVEKRVPGSEEKRIDLCECQNEGDVCMIENATGIPACRRALDLRDPTGCGGLCALEIEACYLIHVNYSVYACRPLNIKPKCETDEWQCKNLLCVASEKRCDGTIDCYDRSDEADCANCDLARNFQCGNRTSCLDKDKKCDGIVDCWDGFDEENCPNGCSAGEFSCKSGECVTASSFCDGYRDCADGSDEVAGCKRNCGPDEFRCLNGRCVPARFRCNRFDNCGDMSDESRCLLR